MSYSKDHVSSVRLDATPSMQFNNLSVSGGSKGCLAFTHKQEVCILPIASTQSEACVSPTKLQISTAGPEVKAVLCEVPEAYLVVLLFNGFQVWDAEGQSMLLTHTLHDDSEGPIKSPQAAAAEEVAGAARAKAGSAAVDALLSPARANCAVGIPSSSSILVGTSTGSIIVLDCVGSKVTVSQSLTAHSEPISHMAARGDIVITADEGGAATVWDAKSLSATCTLPQQECVIGFSVPQSSPLHPAPRNSPAMHSDFCTSVALLPLFIIAGYASGIVRLFSVSEGLLLAEVAGHARCITAVDAHPAADVFSSVSEDGTLNVWSVSGTADSCSKVGLVTTASVTDHSLTGVQFLKSAPHHIITSAYDVHNLRILLSV